MPATPKATPKATIKTTPKAMTKAQVITYLAEKNELTKKQVAAFLDSYNELAYKEAKKSKKFTIPGIGILKLGKRKARTGRNPATGEAIKIPARTAVKISVAKVAKDAILGAK